MTRRLRLRPNVLPLPLVLQAMALPTILPLEAPVAAGLEAGKPQTCSVELLQRVEAQEALVPPMPSLPAVAAALRAGGHTRP